MSSRWSFAHTTGAQAWRELAAEWQDLADRLGDPLYFQQPHWFEAYLQICDRPDDLIWLTAREGGRLCAVLPVQRMVKRLGPLKVSDLRLINHGHMTLADVCCAHESAELWRAWWHWLNSSAAPRWDRIAVRHTPSDSVWSEWMRDFAPAHSLSSVASSSARTDCRRTLDDLLKACSAKHRSNLSRGRKRAEVVGPLRYEHARTVEELARVFPTFLAIESSGWKGEAGSAVASNPKVLKFYETLLAGFGPRQGCEIDVLYVGERPVASVMWLRTAREIHLQKIGYVQELADASPGKLLMREAFARACADPTLDRLCFITHPDWADPWIPESNPVLEYSLFREGLWGGMLWRLTKYRRRMQEKARD